MPSLSPARRGVTWPRSFRCDASLVPYPDIGPSGADNSAWAERAQQCLFVVMVPDWSRWLRVRRALSLPKVSSAAILVSIITSREFHDRGACVALSAVCWF
jgi:hypothetical protein